MSLKNEFEVPSLRLRTKWKYNYKLKHKLAQWSQLFSETVIKNNLRLLTR